jgi:MoaA/NifB/PqqE/SkfB family radical SAM enzyme
MRHGFFQKLFSLRRRKQFFAWQIEITTRCPLSCRMCIRHGRSDWVAADMSLCDFEKLVPYFQDVGTIILQGWGEPLLHKDLSAIIRAAKSTTNISNGPSRHTGDTSPAVGFVTSGKGLDVRLSSELMDAGIDFIGFSFAGSTAKTHEAIRLNSDFRELIHAVAAFNELRKKRGLAGLRAHIVYVMLKDNLHDIPALPRLAHDIGIQEIFLTNLIQVTNSWQDEQRIFTCEDRNDALEVLSAADEEARKTGVRLRISALSPSPVAVCEENPLRNLYISAGGEVSPCVFLHPPTSPRFTKIFCGQEYGSERVSFGNVFQEPFNRIWNGLEYSLFREPLIRRARRSQEMFLPFWSFENNQERGAGAFCPEPPAACRICHKMLGV